MLTVGSWPLCERTCHTGSLSCTTTILRASRFPSPKDNGETWSPLNILYQGGRMHAELTRMPDGRLVMTYIVRQDYEGIRRVSYRRGCEASSATIKA